LVEQRIENPRVGGSNPPPGTIFPNPKSFSKPNECCTAVFILLAGEMTHLAALFLQQMINCAVR
jgi:hypothetical protein